MKRKDPPFSGWLEKRPLYHGSVEYLFAVTCQCGADAGTEWFRRSEPRVKLCAVCLDWADRADCDSFRVEVDELSPAKPVITIAAECLPGKSSGKERKSIGSMGSGENANGCWDNLVRAMDD